MNHHPDNPISGDDQTLPADLLALSGALDGLAAADRAAAGSSFEQRLADSTLPGLPIVAAPVAGEVDSLARADRHAASPSLEDRIFVATRGLLARPATAPAETGVVVIRRVRPLRWVSAAAAVLALGAGVALLTLANRPVPNSDPTIVQNTPTSTEIAKQLEDDFQSLGAILTVALGGSETETASSSGDTASLDDLELPRFDFLNSDTEGSL